MTDFAAYERWLHGCVDCGYAKGRGVVGHISRILFHGESAEEQRRFLEESDFLRNKRRSLMTDFNESCLSGRPAPVVSAVIPSRDHPDILRQCLEGVKKSGGGHPA